MMYENLPEKLEYIGEFGSEIVLFIPFLRFLNNKGLLKNRKIITYPGMEIFYKASDLPLPEIKNEKRRHLYTSKLIPWLPIWENHDPRNQKENTFYDYPNYRKFFKKTNLKLNFLFEENKPLFIIFNKVNSEWGGYPVNYFDAKDLSKIFSLLENKFNLIYCQHSLFEIDKKQYAEDDDEIPNPHGIYKRIESKIIKRKINSINSNIIRLLSAQSPKNFTTIQNLYEKSTIKKNYSYNELNCKLLSLSKDFISVQGGGSDLLASFGDCNLHILHKKGREYPDSYFNGYYQFIAPKPAKTFVSSNNKKLIKSIINFYNK